MSYDIARKIIYEKRTEAFTLAELDEFYPATETQVAMDQFGGVSIVTKVEGGPMTFLNLDAEAVAAIKSASPPPPD